MFCDFAEIERLDNGCIQYRCANCDRLHTSHYPAHLLHFVCGRATSASFSLHCGGDRNPASTRTTRIIRYGKAVARWIAAGRPVRSDERVREIFNTICRPCQSFNAKGNRCGICGCQILDSEDNVLGAWANILPAAAKGFVNKLRMKSESCPKGQW